MLSKLFPILFAAVTPTTLVVDALSIHSQPKKHVSRADDNPLVFAHFMVSSNPVGPADYDDDMQRAKSLGIDAFALNFGLDSYIDEQLQYAYESAADNDMKVFLSFDFNWFDPSSQAAEIGAMAKKYGSLPAQLMVDNKTFVSSFSGDELNVQALREAAGDEIFFAPNFHPELGTDFETVDAALNWIAWPNDGKNKAPNSNANVTVEEGDNAYLDALGNNNYIAPISPWFFTHFGPEVSYSKNWVFPSDLLWFDRWNEILQLKPRFIEIITWNDYGESHYIGPLASKHTDDGSSKWVNDMPHGGWLDMAKPYIAAYHDGADSVDSYIEEDQVIYWYRRTKRSLDCDATDTTMEPANNDTGNYFQGRPNGWETMQDSVFVVTLLTESGELTVSSGDNTQTMDAPAGANAFAVDMGLGKQSFALSRGGSEVLGGDSLMDITDVCPCGLYNFNPYVGSLPSQMPDALDAEGLAGFTQGLKVSTCSPTPTLGPGATPPTAAVAR